MKQNTFKNLFFLRSNYLNKDGTAAIIVRISIDGERQESTTKLSCEPAKWDKKSGRAMGRSSKVFELNNHIQDIQTLLTNHYYDIQRRHGYVTAEMVRNAYMGITQRRKSRFSKSISSTSKTQRNSWDRARQTLRYLQHMSGCTVVWWSS